MIVFQWQRYFIIHFYSQDKYVTLTRKSSQNILPCLKKELIKGILFLNISTRQDWNGNFTADTIAGEYQGSLVTDGGVVLNLGSTCYTLQCDLRFQGHRMARLSIGSLFSSSPFLGTCFNRIYKQPIISNSRKNAAAAVI